MPTFGWRRSDEQSKVSMNQEDLQTAGEGRSQRRESPGLLTTGMEWEDSD
jgi:hypothetical protein